VKIAVSGKGGVGKTTISALLARAFLEKGYTVLAIDADPNPNLALALGVPLKNAENIVPISENAPLIEEKTGVKAQNYGGVFRLSFQVDDIIRRFGIVTPSGVNLVVMGAVRSTGQGCMCPANALIRSLLRHLLMKPEEVVIVDMEAGLEHFGRGTAEHVDAMLVVTESGVRSLETARRTYKLAKDAGIGLVYLIGNRVTDSDSKRIRDFSESILIPLIGLVPFDETLRQLDTQEQGQDASLTASHAFAVVREISDRLRLQIGEDHHG